MRSADLPTGSREVRGEVINPQLVLRPQLIRDPKLQLVLDPHKSTVRNALSLDAPKFSIWPNLESRLNGAVALTTRGWCLRWFGSRLARLNS